MVLSLLCLAMSMALNPSVPFPIPWEGPQQPLVGISLDAPAGKHGVLGVGTDGRLYFADGTRALFWGTNLSLDANFPSKEVAPLVADRLARFGFNLVRIHGIDVVYRAIGGGHGRWRGIFDPNYPDTQHLDPNQLDLLDYLIAQLKAKGINIDLELYVSRRFLEGDGVHNPEWLRNACYCTLFDPHMIELQKVYARQLLTHRNPYTGLTYAQDPAVVVVEITNENSLFDGWVRGFLRGNQTSPPTSAWTDIPPYYAQELTQFYNAWLKTKYPNRAALAQAWNVGAQPAGPSMLVNGDFGQGTTGWSLSLTNSASATLQTANDNGNPCAQVTVTSVTGTDWHVMLRQGNLTLQKDKTYRVTFRMKANSQRSVVVGVSHPFPHYGHGSGRFQVGTDWKEFSFTFRTLSDVNDDYFNGVIVGFSLGLQTGTVWIDDVVLQADAVFGLRDDEDPWQGTVRRLDPTEFYNATAARFRDEGRFYFETERNYYEQMREFLKKELGVKALVTGTNFPGGGLPNVMSQVASWLDLMNNHIYWDHPVHIGTSNTWPPTNWTIKNKPLLDSPKENTIFTLCRFAVAGKPLIVTEYNHPFPSEYACESPLLIAAYAALQDWDGVCIFTFAHKWTTEELGQDANGGRVGGVFDIVNNPIQMCQMPVASLLFRRRYVDRAQRLVTLTYDESRVYESLRHPRPWENWFQTDGAISRLLPLVHRVRLTFGNRTTRANEVGFTEPQGSIVSDTGRVKWEANGAGTGLLTIGTPQLQAAVGWLGGRVVTTSGGNAQVTFNIQSPQFCTVSLVSCYGESLVNTSKILIVAAARSANTGMEWNANRNGLINWGGPPVLIEPVVGEIILKRADYSRMRLTPLDGNMNRKGDGMLVTSVQENGVWFMHLPLRAEKGTVWYLLEPY